jgi:hypothetical protein
MTRIKVFKASQAFSGFFIIFGSIFAIFGIVQIVIALIDGFDKRFPSGDWNAIFFTAQGLLFVIMGTGNLATAKYFMEWDDKELRYLLPGINRIKTIKTEDIKSVNIRLFEIELILSDGSTVLDLNNLQFEDLRKIKEHFEKLKITN